MKNGEWRARLNDALVKSDLSKRAASLKAGLGPGYIHSILVEGKDPTIERLISVCEVLGVSPAYILHGVNIRPGEADLLALIQKHPAKREAILALLGDQ